MKVVMIGSGNVATVLGRLIKNRGHEILQVVSRHIEHAKTLAALLDCSSTDDGGVIDTGADLYIIAVSDNALYELNRSFHLGNKLIVHTAGSVSKAVLKDISVNYGVLYPLQSLRREMDAQQDIPLLIDANSTDARQLIGDFARTLTGSVTPASDDERLKQHVAAVIVNNFTNHLYSLAEEFCTKEQVDFKLLVPLIRETANRVASHSPADVQTGPALRNDVFTLDKHLRLLAAYPKLKYIYLKLTESIMNP